ncbi:uncharacterized protein LOC124123458 [Haliotis rufescens]|uniref:uncharacterized protein LOC124123458 n=1 Tax=Haliotis rufescens TaxID=6454 RepID=UPI001EB09C97|nr:uncharacterized protein LOC124123458 [Haliotis rufescens]
MAEYCDIQFDWDCDRDPNSIIDYFQENDEKDKMYGLEFFSFPSKLEVFKVADDESSNCHLTIRCKSVYHVGITGVQIVSESRNMEVYGQTEGYMHTIRGKSVPKSEDDTHYFISYLSTQEPTNCLTFKFLSLKDRASFLIKRLQITLTQMAPPDSSTQMDIGKLRNHVKELGDKVSDKAKSLLDTMEQYQNNQRGALDNVRSMISESSLPPDKETSLSGMAGLLSMFSKMNTSMPRNPSTVPMGDNGTNNPSDLAGNLLTHMSMSQNGDSLHSDDMYKFLQSVCGRVSKLRHTENTNPGIIPTNSDVPATQNHVDPAVLEEVSKQIHSAEERILTQVQQQMLDMEARLNNKMDRILQLLSPAEESISESEEEPASPDKIPSPQAIDLD